MKKVDNRGFSLVELIVVIAILGILSGVVSYSVNQIFSNKIRKFASECNAMLTRCRVDTLSGSLSEKVQLRMEDGYYYVALLDDSDTLEEEKLKNTNFPCTYTDDSGTVTFSDGDALELSFNRSTGAFNETCTEISIADTKITLVPSTGYHAIGK